MNDKNSPKSEESHLRQPEFNFSNDKRDIVTDHFFPDRGCYTDDEIQEALEKMKQIEKDIFHFTRIGFKIAKLIYDFKEKKMYHRLGFRSFNDWILNISLPRATVYRYLQSYIDLTVRSNIPLKEYDNIDVGKVRAVRPLVKAGAQTGTVREILKNAKKYDLSSIQVCVEEEITSINQKTDDEKRKKEVISENTPEEKNQQLPVQQLDSGFYKLTLVELKSTSQKDFVKKEGLERVAPFRSSLFYDAENQQFVVYIKNAVYPIDR